MRDVNVIEKSGLSAIYLIGHGPLREPRPLELQRLRIERYIGLLREQEKKSVYVSADDVFVDINYPRTTPWESSRAFPALGKLVAAIDSGKYSQVFVDIAPPNGPQLGAEWVPEVLSKKGTQVVNVYHDEHRLLDPILESYGAEGHEVLVRAGAADSEDMFTFFPVMSGRMMSWLVSKNKEQEVPWSIMRMIERFCHENPYGGGRFPTFSGVTTEEFLHRKWEQKEKIKSKRLREETLLCLAPNDGEKALLLDDLFLEKPRTNERWAWAEARLSSLGFEKKLKERLISFARRVDDALVYADPRAEGRIHFHVYDANDKSKNSRVRLTFSIPDAWKNELEEKLLRQIRGRTSRASGKK